MAQLEAAQDRAASLEAQLEEALAASKRKNSSAWRLRQENQQLKTELSTKNSSLEKEFEQRQKIREAAEVACERTRQAATKEMEMAHSVARQAHAAADEEVSRIGKAAVAAALQIDAAMTSQMKSLTEHVLSSLSQQETRVERLQSTSTRVRTELITAQRAAVVAGMEAAQAETEMVEAEAARNTERKLREDAEQRAAIAIQRLSKGPAGSPANSPERTEWSAATTRSGQRPGKLEEALAEALAARVRAEQACMEAEAQALKAEERAEQADIAAQQAMAEAEETITSTRAEAETTMAAAVAENRASAALRLAAEDKALSATAEVRRLQVRVAQLEREIRRSVKTDSAQPAVPGEVYDAACLTPCAATTAFA